MKKSFSLIEIIIVLIVIGILYTSMSFTLLSTNLNTAQTQIIADFNYVKNLAFQDNKFQYYPSNNDINKTKYWFKQWWSIKFNKYEKDNKTYYYYEIFSDLPNYDKIAQKEEILELNNKLMTGNESIDNYNIKLNLTKTYNITKITYKNLPENPIIMFDNYGNIYINNSNNDNDINPYDINQRKPLLSTAQIKICSENKCKILKISPKIGNIYED